MTVPDMRAQVADLIDQAINVLHERGWCQGELIAEDGSVCVEGAVYKAASCTRNKWTVHALEALNDAAGEAVWRFNDADGTTVEDVVLTMKQAAASLREPQP